MARYTTPAIALAMLAALGAGNAAATDDAFERMTYREFRYMLRDAHLAYQKDDHARAFELYRRNACTGDKDSQFALGSMYLYGQGTQADGLKAYAWLATAAEAREPKYQKVFAQVAQAVPSEHRKAAERAADELRSRYGMAAANVHCAMRAEAGTKISKLECKPPIEVRTGYVEVKRCE